MASISFESENFVWPRREVSVILIKYELCFDLEFFLDVKLLDFISYLKLVLKNFV
jgi:hypothetical protein